jgi:hypothetical protein
MSDEELELGLPPVNPKVVKPRALPKSGISWARYTAKPAMFCDICTAKMTFINGVPKSALPRVYAIRYTPEGFLRLCGPCTAEYKQQDELGRLKK